MLVKKWMTPNVITVNAEDSMQEAIHVLKENKLHLLPVMHKGKLVGIISDGDLKKASPSDATTLDIHELVYLTSKIKVRDLMKKNPYCVSPDYSVEEAAAILLEKSISGLPVTDNTGALVGIITKSDIFRVLISLTGQANRGIQIAMILEDKPGSIKKVRDVIHEFQARTASILSSNEDADDGYIKVYFRIYDIDRSRLHEMTEVLRKTGQLMYIIDHREDKRELFTS